MARFCSLYSSSSGNCTYIGSSTGGILIDCGVSAKRICEALDGIGVEPSSISAIFITHCHSDHTGGLRVFQKKYGIPCYATLDTLRELVRMKSLCESVPCYDVGNGAKVSGFSVKPFPTSHDAPGSCGYTVLTPDGKRISVATDMGIITPAVMEAITGSELVLLESNHDVAMLKTGSYPYELKRRILSDKGHLSNDSCAATAVELVKTGTTRLVLGHLSKENNYPPLAEQTTKSALECAGLSVGTDCLLTVAGDLNEMIKL